MATLLVLPHCAAVAALLAAGLAQPSATKQQQELCCIRVLVRVPFTVPLYVRSVLLGATKPRNSVPHMPRRLVGCYHRLEKCQKASFLLSSCLATGNLVATSQKALHPCAVVCFAVLSVQRSRTSACAAPLPPRSDVPMSLKVVNAKNRSARGKFAGHPAPLLRDRQSIRQSSAFPGPNIG